MKYRFHASELPHPPHRSPRSYRLRGSDTLRKKRHLPEPIEHISLFEFGELPDGEPAPRKPRKKRLSSLLRLLRRLKNGGIAVGAAIGKMLGALVRKRGDRKKRTELRSLAVYGGAFCAALLVSLLSAASVLWGLFGGYGRSYVSVTVPNFVGKAPDAALSDADAPFQLILQYDYNPDVPSGQVISQTPPAGVNRRLYGEEDFCTILLTVSRERERYQLENLVGMTRRDAALRLRNAGIQATVTEEYSATLPKGKVLRTIPPAGTPLAEGETVTLTVSAGKQILRVRVPDLFGLTEAQADSLLRSAGLTVGEISYMSSAYPVGTVVAQEPRALTTAETGSAVSFTVSAGDRYAMRVIPDLYGMSQAEAADKLREYGLVIGSVYPVATAAPKGTVITQSPVAGMPITSATVSVDLYVSS